MLVVAEADVGQLQLAAPLDVDLLGPFTRMSVIVSSRSSGSSGPRPTMSSTIVAPSISCSRPRQGQALLGDDLGDQLEDLAVSSSRGSLVAAAASIRS